MVVSATDGRRPALASLKTPLPSLRRSVFFQAIHAAIADHQVVVAVTVDITTRDAGRWPVRHGKTAKRLVLKARSTRVDPELVLSAADADHVGIAVAVDIDESHRVGRRGFEWQVLLAVLHEGLRREQGGQQQCSRDPQRTRGRERTRVLFAGLGAGARHDGEKGQGWVAEYSGPHSRRCLHRQWTAHTSKDAREGTG